MAELITKYYENTNTVNLTVFMINGKKMVKKNIIGLMDYYRLFIILLMV